MLNGLSGYADMSGFPHGLNRDTEARDALRSRNRQPPISIYHRYITALRGQEKLSARRDDLARLLL